MGTPFVFHSDLRGDEVGLQELQFGGIRRGNSRSCIASADPARSAWLPSAIGPAACGRQVEACGSGSGSRPASRGSAAVEAASYQPFSRLRIGGPPSDRSSSIEFQIWKSSAMHGGSSSSGRFVRYWGLSQDRLLVSQPGRCSPEIKGGGGIVEIAGVGGLLHAKYHGLGA